MLTDGNFAVDYGNFAVTYGNFTRIFVAQIVAQTVSLCSSGNDTMHAEHLHTEYAGSFGGHRNMNLFSEGGISLHPVQRLCPSGKIKSSCNCSIASLLLARAIEDTVLRRADLFPVVL